MAEEILVHVLDEFDMFEPSITTNEEEIVNDILKDLMGKDDEFLDSFVAKVGEDFNIFKFVDANDSGKANVLDDSNFGVENEQISSTLQQLQYKVSVNYVFKMYDALTDFSNRSQYRALKVNEIHPP